MADQRWRDGSEERLLAVLRSASDRSTASDELASHITDWPSRYHLDRRRTNLLRPLLIGPGMTVLDVGAGTGVNSRYLAEAGASVVAIEGDALRAEMAGVRCEGLDVDVQVGDATSITAATHPDGFDMVVCIGVLEYSGTDPGAFLTHLASLVRPGGALVVAIENQMGLAYWLGANEDHLGKPFVGLAGYPGDTGGIRTHSRSGLAGLLSGAGMSAQRWLYPFPDYKLPMAVLTDNAYRVPDAVEFVDQIVGPPVDRLRMGATAGPDSRAAHRELVAAGLGPDMANSFLVVAGADQGAVDSACGGDVLAWRFTGDRRSCFMQERRVTSAGGRSVIDRRRSFPDDPLPAEPSWLTLREPTTEPVDYLSGPNLEQAALACLRAHDLTGLSDVLTRFDSFLTGLASAGAPGSAPHPYLPAGSAAVLPADCVDLGLDNLVPLGDEGGLSLVDDEWSAEGGVDRELATIRAMWKLAWVTVASGTDHPWPTTATVDEIAVSLLGLLPGGVGADPLERLYAAEAELLAVVAGGSAGDHLENLRATGHRSVAGKGGSSLADLRRRLSWLKHLPGGRWLARATRG
ncbi:MAG: methyltransferase domain-containing protein [Gammaproteobacteria bacterium]|nr:methyltransferase domain-containing protein [Gammaproteobacteria bacterium]